MDLFVRQPATLAGNLDAQKFQCPVVSRNSAAAPSSIPVFTQGAHSPKAVEYMEEVSLRGLSFVKSAQLVGDHNNWFQVCLVGSSFAFSNWGQVIIFKFIS